MQRRSAPLPPWDGGWRAAPKGGGVLGGRVPVGDGVRFRDGLASWQDHTVGTGPMGHSLSADAPVGVVRGVAQLRPLATPEYGDSGDFVFRTNGIDEPDVEPAAVQRVSDGSARRRAQRAEKPVSRAAATSPSVEPSAAPVEGGEVPARAATSSRAVPRAKKGNWIQRLLSREPATRQENTAPVARQENTAPAVRRPETSSTGTPLVSPQEPAAAPPTREFVQRRAATPAEPTAPKAPQVRRSAAAQLVNLPKRTVRVVPNSVRPTKTTAQRTTTQKSPAPKVTATKSSTPKSSTPKSSTPEPSTPKPSAPKSTAPRPAASEPAASSAPVSEASAPPAEASVDVQRSVPLLPLTRPLIAARTPEDLPTRQIPAVVQRATPTAQPPQAQASTPVTVEPPSTAATPELPLATPESPHATSELPLATQAKNIPGSAPAAVPDVQRSVDTAETSARPETTASEPKTRPRTAPVLGAPLVSSAPAPATPATPARPGVVRPSGLGAPISAIPASAMPTTNPLAPIQRATTNRGDTPPRQSTTKNSSHQSIPAKPTTSAPAATKPTATKPTATKPTAAESDAAKLSAVTPQLIGADAVVQRMVPLSPDQPIASLRAPSAQPQVERASSESLVAQLKTAQLKTAQFEQGSPSASPGTVISPTGLPLVRPTTPTSAPVQRATSPVPLITRNPLRPKLSASSASPASAAPVVQRAAKPTVRSTPVVRPIPSRRLDTGPPSTSAPHQVPAVPVVPVTAVHRAPTPWNTVPQGSASQTHATPTTAQRAASPSTAPPSVAGATTGPVATTPVVTSPSPTGSTTTSPSATGGFQWVNPRFAAKQNSSSRPAAQPVQRAEKAAQPPSPKNAPTPIPPDHTPTPAPVKGDLTAPDVDKDEQGQDRADLDALARKLVEPLSRLMRNELRRDRDRVGRPHDHRR
ncbi:hypothetical protein KCV87_05285 [Actinosynnema pretiosum subsp. pretiosum]|uniref:Uncharacterized protein n=1 Tax=Actinosynnema pretiosum subsp. pretiosum TaxID=103721 RepID=A0AA45L8D4_9PSEU|nr:hypothetical protein KCV87_05285 [Actinosynnema pretiosum subsp. pretiosum]